MRTCVSKLACELSLDVMIGFFCSVDSDWLKVFLIVIKKALFFVLKSIGKYVTLVRDNTGTPDG